MSYPRMGKSVCTKVSYITLLTRDLQCEIEMSWAICIMYSCITSMYYVFHLNRDGQLNTILYYTILYYTILYYTRICIILSIGGDIISQLRGSLASFFEETSRMLSSFLDREISYASKHPGISYWSLLLIIYQNTHMISGYGMYLCIKHFCSILCKTCFFLFSD